MKEDINPTQIRVIREKSAVPVYYVNDEGLVKIGENLINFVKGNKEDPTVYRQAGFMVETLLAVCLKYLEENNVGELHNLETDMVIERIDQAITLLKLRAIKRRERGVQGTYRPLSWNDDVI